MVIILRSEYATILDIRKLLRDVYCISIPQHVFHENFFKKFSENVRFKKIKWKLTDLMMLIIAWPIWLDVAPSIVLARLSDCNGVVWTVFSSRRTPAGSNRLHDMSKSAIELPANNCSTLSYGKSVESIVGAGTWLTDVMPSFGPPSITDLFQISV